MVAYHEANKVDIASKKALYYKENKERIIAKATDTKKKSVDEFYTLYYLKEEHYIGITNQPTIRMYTHKSRGKHVSNYESVATFKTKRAALDAEAICHDILGYKGSNKPLTLKLQKND